MANSEGRPAIPLLGRVILKGQIAAVTGLHIGTSKETMEIGGVDMPIVRNPVDRVPYIPGSSLKGKMRSLWEKFKGVDFNDPIGKSDDPAKRVYIHTCKRIKKSENEHESDSAYAERYNACPVCSIYGVTGDAGAPVPTRLIVRDIRLDENSIPLVKDQGYTEVKWEAAIDRVTSAATPRQMERVPAGAIFSPMELVFSFYRPEDVTRFADVLTALQLVEDDYLGGQGSRGSGKVQFEALTLTLRVGAEYQTVEDARFIGQTVGGLLQQKRHIQDWIREHLPLGGA